MLKDDNFYEQINKGNSRSCMVTDVQFLGKLVKDTSKLLFEKDPSS